MQIECNLFPRNQTGSTDSQRQSVHVIAALAVMVGGAVQRLLTPNLVATLISGMSCEFIHWSDSRDCDRNL